MPRRRPRSPLTALLFGLLAALAPGSGCKAGKDRVDLTRYVLIYPAASRVQMPEDRASLPVLVRNVSPGKLTGLRLSVKSACCEASVTPSLLGPVIPGDRGVFQVTLVRRAGQANGRFPLLLTLRSPDLPVAAGMDLMLDLGPVRDGQWLDVGQVELVARGDSRAAYWLLAGAPLALLLAWLLRRAARGRRGIR